MTKTQIRWPLSFATRPCPTYRTNLRLDIEGLKFVYWWYEPLSATHFILFKGFFAPLK